jgi:hypothetical protein
MPGVFGLNELVSHIISFLSLEDLSTFRLVCREFEEQSRIAFASKYLTSCRILLTQQHLSSFLSICSSGSEITSRIQELHISLYMVKPSCALLLHRIMADISKSSTCGQLTGYFGAYFNKFKVESQFARHIPHALAMVLTKLPMLRVIKLSARAPDIGDYIQPEKRILQGLSELPYQRCYHRGGWRFMQLQRAKAIAVTVEAVASLDPPMSLHQLVIDRRLHIPGGVDLSTSRLLGCSGSPERVDLTLYPFTRFLQHIKSLEISVSEHSFSNSTSNWHGVWLVKLINAATNLRHLTLMFHPVVSFSQLWSFFFAINTSNLLTLNVSGLTWIENPRTVIEFAQKVSSCALTLASTVLVIERTLKVMRRQAPNLASCHHLPPTRFGRFWFSESGRVPQPSHMDWNAISQGQAGWNAIARGLICAQRRVSPCSVFLVPTIHWSPRIDWSCVRLQVVDTRADVKLHHIYLPQMAFFLSWHSFLFAISYATKLSVFALEARYDLVHVSTDGIPVLKRIDEHYLNSRAFEEGIAAADYWIEKEERDSCCVTIEICNDGKSWADYKEILCTALGIW